MDNQRFEVKYNNSTGPQDDYYEEWIEIVDTTIPNPYNENYICKVHNDIDADKLCKFLNDNNYEP